MSVEIRFESEIRWDGNKIGLSCQIRRSDIVQDSTRTIHEVPPFCDVLMREIARDRVEIFERLRPALTAKIVREASSQLELQPTDLAA